MAQPTPLKFVLVGDGAVGKSALFHCYHSHGEFLSEYVPTTFDTANCNALFKGRPISLTINDTAGQFEYSEMRELVYPNTDCFLLCYSVVNPSSLENCCTYWMNELRKSNEGKNAQIPIILVGTKIDLRDDVETLKRLEDLNTKPVTKEEGEKTARELGCAAFIEVSSLTNANVPDAFNKGLEVYHVNAGIKHSKNCEIM